MVRKASCVWPEGPLRGFEDCRLNSTAANVRVWTQVYVSYVSTVACANSILTGESGAKSSCSDRPIKSTSGLCANHSWFNCSSAAVRSTLSGDCRPRRRFVRAAWMCSGRDAILAPGCAELECDPDVEGGRGVTRK
jgi:hypothetical protein